MSADRLAAGYEPRFDIDYAVGHEGERYVEKDVIAAFTTGRVEVKNDQLAAKTRNVYIEFSCLRRGSWHRSGIETTEATFWAIVLADSVVVVVPTDVLRVATVTAWGEGLKSSCERGSHPTKGVLLPVDQLVRRFMRAAQETRLGGSTSQNGAPETD